MPFGSLKASSPLGVLLGKGEEELPKFVVGRSGMQLYLFVAYGVLKDHGIAQERDASIGVGAWSSVF